MLKKSLTVYNSIDARQTQEWSKYLQSIGWNIEVVQGTYVFIHTIPFLKRSVIKVQHPLPTYPLNELEQIAQKYKALFVLIEPHCFLYDETPFIIHGYRKSYMRYAHTATIKIDLRKSEHELFSSFSENAKRNIKKAQKNNLIIKEVWFKTDKNNFYFSKFYSLLMQLSKKKKFYSPSYTEYHKKMTAFKDTSVMLFAYEKDKNEPIAVVWYASYGKITTYMQTGITQRGYDLLANYMLVWEGLLLAKRGGQQIFDFESIYDARYPEENKKWKGYSEFKKRFHGTIIEYPDTWIKFYSNAFKWFYLCTSFFPK